MLVGRRLRRSLRTGLPLTDGPAAAPARRPRTLRRPSPGGRHTWRDWTTEAVDTVEQVVGAVRDKTVVPAQKATERSSSSGSSPRSSLLTVALMLVIIACFRVLVIVTGEVWAPS